MTKIETFSLQDDDFALFWGEGYKLTEEECVHHNEVISWLLNGSTSQTDLNDLMTCFQLPPCAAPGLAVAVYLCNALISYKPLYYTMIKTIDIVRKAVV